MELIIAEKADAARRIAEALADGKPVKRDYKNVPCYELKHKNKKILVGCAVGHLFNLTEKEKGWNYPIFDLKWEPSYLVSKQAQFTKKYLEALKIIAKESDSFVVACDYDTEGSLIGWCIIKFICGRKDAKRMKFSTMVKEELIDSYEKASPHLDFPLIESGETRHWLDHYYGISSSRGLMHAIRAAGGGFKILSSGRVQSPVLALLAHREHEIENFKPEKYWQLFALILAKNQELSAIHEKEKFWKIIEAKNVYEKCKGKDAKVSKVIKKEYKVNPPAPFNITSLQTEAYKLFGFSPQNTLNIAEQLYLSANISYPRTSSEKLDPRIGYKSIINSLAKLKEFEILASKIIKKGKLSPNQGKKTDPAHIAIYPTQITPKELNNEQRKIYSLIVKRFLACFADNALRENIKIYFEIEKENFYINGSRTISQGWISFYEPYVKFKEISLPDLKENECFKVKNLELKENETKPPNRYTQGSIIAEMEKRGLGTRATRSIILQILYNRAYVEDKSIKVTKLGKAVASTLEKYVPELISEKLTKHFEKELEQIQQKKKTKEQILEEAKKILTKIFAHFKKNEKKIGIPLLEAYKKMQEEANMISDCPECKGQLRIMFSKKNKKYFVACNKYPDCKTTFSVPQNALIKPTHKICTECKYPTVLVIRKGRKPFEYCLNRKCPKKLEWLKKMGIKST